MALVSEFPVHQAEWQRLNRLFGESPLLDPLFVMPLIDCFANGHERLAIARSGDRIVALGLFHRSGRSAWQVFQPANAPLGLLVLDPGVITSVADLDHSQLARHLPGLALLIGWSQIDPDHWARPDSVGPVETLDYIDTARVHLAGDYDAYWAARGKNLRHNMNRQRNRLARDATEMRLERLTGREDMARAVADYADLESSGWKQASDSAVQRADPQGRFYAKMLAAFAARGEALVLRLFYDQRLVASDLCLLRAGILIILKTTHDETCKGTSPAHLMRHEMIKDGFRSGEIRVIEFYGPVRDWHLKWTEDVRTLYHLNLYRWSPIRTLHQRRRGSR